MNKERESDAIEFIVTYADNAAIPFFEKQGFFAVSPIDRKPWLKKKKKVNDPNLMLDERCKFQKIELMARIEHYRRATLMCFNIEDAKDQFEVDKLSLKESVSISKCKSPVE